MEREKFRGKWEWMRNVGDKKNFLLQSLLTINFVILS